MKSGIFLALIGKHFANMNPQKLFLNVSLYKVKERKCSYVKFLIYGATEASKKKSNKGKSHQGREAIKVKVTEA